MSTTPHIVESQKHMQSTDLITVKLDETRPHDVIGEDGKAAVLTRGIGYLPSCRRTVGLSDNPLSKEHTDMYV